MIFTGKDVAIAKGRGEREKEETKPAAENGLGCFASC